MADLDAPFLTKNDPFKGVNIAHQKITVDAEITLKDNSIFFNF